MYEHTRIFSGEFFGGFDKIKFLFHVFTCFICKHKRVCVMHMFDYVCNTCRSVSFYTACVYVYIVCVYGRCLRVYSRCVRVDCMCVCVYFMCVCVHSGCVSVCCRCVRVCCMCVWVCCMWLTSRTTMYVHPCAIFHTTPHTTSRLYIHTHTYTHIHTHTHIISQATRWQLE